MKAYSLPSEHSENVAERLVHEFISRFGAILKSIQSQFSKEVLKLFEIKKTRTTAYRPNSIGLIERFNGILGGIIRKFVEHNKNRWDKYSSLLLAAYRVTPHPAT